MLETLVALAILSLALTSSVALMAQYQALDLRLEGQLEAQRCIEAEHEALRGGLALPLAEGVHELPVIREPAEPVEELRFTADVTPSPTDGLYEVTLEARYRIGRKRFQRRIEMRLWRG